MFHNQANKKNKAPTQNQQTGQWYFYDDQGKPVDLKVKPTSMKHDEDSGTTCCFGRKK